MVIQFYFNGELLAKRTGESVPASGETVKTITRKMVAFDKMESKDIKFRVINRVWDMSADPMWVHVYLEKDDGSI
jgi:hypothetical protein